MDLTSTPVITVVVKGNSGLQLLGVPDVSKLCCPNRPHDLEDGEFVVVERLVTDTKPHEKKRGICFFEVRRLRPDDVSREHRRGCPMYMPIEQRYQYWLLGVEPDGLRIRAHKALQLHTREDFSIGMESVAVLPWNAIEYALAATPRKGWPYHGYLPLLPSYKGPLSNTGWDITASEAPFINLRISSSSLVDAYNKSTEQFRTNT